MSDPGSRSLLILCRHRAGLIIVLADDRQCRAVDVTGVGPVGGGAAADTMGDRRARSEPDAEAGIDAVPEGNLMQQWTVRDVMTAEVLTVDYDSPTAEVVTTMTTYDVSAVAVVDRYDSVLGVITRTDVLNGIQVREPERRSRAPWRWHVATPTWIVHSAGRMINAPALTVEPSATLAEAGRLMRRRAVNRLLVSGHDRRLLGIVTAADLLKVYDRPDETVRVEVQQALATLPTSDVAFDVHDGVTFMAGTVADAQIAALLPRLVRDVSGVTAVRSELTTEPPVAASVALAVPAVHRPMDGWWQNRRPQQDTRIEPASMPR